MFIILTRYQVNIFNFIKELVYRGRYVPRNVPRKKHKGIGRNKKWNDVAWINRSHHGINKVTGKKY